MAERVLIVDDDLRLAQLVRTILDQHGFDILPQRTTMHLSGQGPMWEARFWTRPWRW